MKVKSTIMSLVGGLVELDVGAEQGHGFHRNHLRQEYAELIAKSEGETHLCILSDKTCPGRWFH